MTVLLKNLLEGSAVRNLVNIDEWFSAEDRRRYVALLKGKVGLTRRRAECFVKLWVYLLLKQQQELGNTVKKPLTELHLPEGFVACTLREANELFYAEE